ncbi:MAG TPA: response regulator [Verrucomicrobiae bacterium]|nr:response regulator [Verrucomicrobiae bacterium]
MKTLFIVDDEEDLIKILSVQLIKVGYKVVSAYRYHEALGLIDQHKPDFFLLDYVIAGESGADLCRWIRGKPELESVPVVFMTASPQMLTPRHMQSIRASDYLIKPFHFAELLEKINGFLKT